MSRNVYVFAEQRDGNIQKVAYELVGKARELADTLDEKVYAVLAGEGIKDKAGSLIGAGADGVVLVEDPMLAEYTTCLLYTSTSLKWPWQQETAAVSLLFRLKRWYRKAPCL